jgi:hypothetical protein
MLDAITEAVVKPEDPKVRAEVISDLVQEIDEVVKWRHATDGDLEELRSLQEVVDAATKHVERMSEVSEVSADAAVRTDAAS